MNEVMFSSSSDRWGTPQTLFDQISEVFGPFDIDPCAEPWNAKATRYITEQENGLVQAWCRLDGSPGNAFINPPFSREKKMRIEPWIEITWERVRGGGLVQGTMLIPAKSDIGVWHDVIFPHAAVIAFVKGRIRFVRSDGSSGPATFPSAIVVFRRAAGAGALPKQQLITTWEQR